METSKFKQLSWKIDWDVGSLKRFYCVFANFLGSKIPKNVLQLKMSLCGGGLKIEILILVPHCLQWYKQMIDDIEITYRCKAIRHFLKF